MRFSHPRFVLIINIVYWLYSTDTISYAPKFNVYHQPLQCLKIYLLYIFFQSGRLEFFNKPAYHFLQHVAV